MTNYGARAILALPKMPERRLRLMLALETLPRREGGWREAKTGKLAEHAGLSVNTAVRARGELAASGAIEYRRGNGQGHVSAYRIKVTNDAGYLHRPAKVPNDAGDLERYPNEPREGTQTSPVKVPIGYSPTSQNVSGQLEASQLEPSQLSRGPRAARDPRTLLDGLEGIDDRLRDFILEWMGDRGVRDPFAYLLEITGRPEHDDHGIRRFLDRRRRDLAGQDPDGDGDPPPPPKPPWCGKCDEQTRLRETDDDRLTRCPDCHPWRDYPPGYEGPR